MWCGAVFYLSLLYLLFRFVLSGRGRWVCYLWLFFHVLERPSDDLSSVCLPQEIRKALFFLWAGEESRAERMRWSGFHVSETSHVSEVPSGLLLLLAFDHVECCDAYIYA